MTGYAVAGTGRSGSPAATTATEALRSPAGGRGPAVAGRGPEPCVAAEPGEVVDRGLGLLDGELVGQGPPPALGSGVVDLLHYAFAVPGPGRADAHTDAVVLRDAGERAAYLAGVGVAHGCHPVEAPRS